MPNGETLYPLEVVIRGTPASLQTKNPRYREAWKERVAEAARERQRETYPLGFLDQRPLAVTIYYFPSDPMVGDIDNIVKPIMDGMNAVAYLDDSVVERVVVQKFGPERGWAFAAPSDRLTLALDSDRPVVYIRVDDDLSWRRA
ncbi:MAG: RusA family crossover junction endodeoxyribonuclease [Hyphomicrobiales bacterium]|nr:RusA family crossover junction endodeoxyribonuclease [Hyphomicrobiales bacterium]MBV8663209.1 RusA family crossover junction endodeoxyribonuclease [Hyphomicrobiales bacterium]